MHSSATPDGERIEQAARGLLGGIGRLSRALFRAGDFGVPRSYVSILEALERRRLTEDRRVTRAHITPLGRELLEQARRRMAATLLEALHANVDDPEATVAAAREAVCTIVKALEPETI
jgi:hypothetical protein